MQVFRNLTKERHVNIVLWRRKQGQLSVVKAVYTWKRLTYTFLLWNVNLSPFVTCVKCHLKNKHVIVVGRTENFNPKIFFSSNNNWYTYKHCERVAGTSEPVWNHWIKFSSALWRFMVSFISSFIHPASTSWLCFSLTALIQFLSYSYCCVNSFGCSRQIFLVRNHSCPTCWALDSRCTQLATRWSI